MPCPPLLSHQPRCAYALHAHAPRSQVSVFGTEGSLRYGGDDQRPTSGALELRRHDTKPAHEVLAPSFLFENYEPSGDGPESLHALVDACVGRPALVSVPAADVFGGLRLPEGYRATWLAPQPHAKGQTPSPRAPTLTLIRWARAQR